MADTEHDNFNTFRDCLFTAVADKFSASEPKLKGKRRATSTKNNLPTSSRSSTKDEETGDSHTNPLDNPAELADFSDFIASEAFETLPQELKRLSFKALQDNVSLSEKWSLPLSLSTLECLAESISPSVCDNLTAYGLIQPPKSDVQSFLSPVFTAYIAAVTSSPPKWTETKTTTCEICERDWIPMTYHHLIPKQTHAKVLKRGWHEESKLNSVAWLCRACHSFVHKMASNEELAREWFTVDRICDREDVQKWAQWVGRVRWKKS